MKKFLFVLVTYFAFIIGISIATSASSYYLGHTGTDISYISSFFDSFSELWEDWQLIFQVVIYLVALVLWLIPYFLLRNLISNNLLLACAILWFFIILPGLYYFFEILTSGPVRIV